LSARASSSNTTRPLYAPYLGTFNGYAGAFTEFDQVRLRDALSEAWQQEATVITTNSDTPMIRELYDQRPFSLLKCCPGREAVRLGGYFSSPRRKLPRNPKSAPYLLIVFTSR
jgi:hypothetical protein